MNPPRVAVVSFAGMAAHARWDAGFNILSATHATRVAEIAGRLTADQVTQLIADLSLDELQPLVELVRGSFPRLNRESVSKVVADHPFLCMAIIEDRLKTDILANADRRLAAAEEHKASIEAMIDRLEAEEPSEAPPRP